MQGTLEKMVVKEGKPVEILFTSNDPKLLGMSVRQIKLLQEKPCTFDFALNLAGPDTEPELPLSDEDPEEALAAATKYAEPEAEPDNDGPVLRPISERALYKALEDTQIMTFSQSDDKGRLSNEDIVKLLSDAWSGDGRSGVIYDEDSDKDVSFTAWLDHVQGPAFQLESGDVLAGDELLLSVRNVLDLPYEPADFFESVTEGDRLYDPSAPAEEQQVFTIIGEPGPDAERVDVIFDNKPDVPVSLTRDTINRCVREDAPDIDRAQVENAPVSTATAYQDDKGNVYRVEINEPLDRWWVVKSDGKTTVEYAVLQSWPYDCQDLAQRTLDEHAAKMGWFALPDSEPDIDRAQAENALYDALMAAPGAKERWEILVKLVPTDYDIKNQLITEFNGGQTEGSSTGWDAGVDEGEPYFKPGINECSWTGDELVSVVRDILNIPHPVEAESKDIQPRKTTKHAEMVVVSETLGDPIVQPFLDPAPASDKVSVGSIITRDKPDGGTPLLLVTEETETGFVIAGNDGNSEITRDAALTLYRVVKEGELVRHMNAPQPYCIWPRKRDDKVDLFYPDSGENGMPVVITRAQVVHYRTMSSEELSAKAPAKEAL